MYNVEELKTRQHELKLNEVRKLFIVGVGGIGSWVSLFSGLCSQVQHLYLWDDDKIEDSNLNRTPFRLEDIGHNKVDAMERLINERRLHDNTLKIEAKNERFTDKVCLELRHSGSDILIDCRDGLYGDIKSFKGKVYKVSYDGFSITIDGDYKNRVIWGQRTGGYEIIPSFICPAVLVAVLVVADIFQKHGDDRLNKMITFDSNNLLEYIFNQTKNAVDGEIKNNNENEDEEDEEDDVEPVAEDEEDIW